VLAFIVARRTREIGIRIALGAQQGAVVRLVMREMLVVILLGLAAGVTAAYLCGSYVETQLFGVKAGDLLVFAVSVTTLLAAALVASFAPAWRASRISPTRALRYDSPPKFSDRTLHATAQDSLGPSPVCSVQRHSGTGQGRGHGAPLPAAAGA
jgi:predicted lysophospholipase L1 biosynthesis ABC-type transport system permease subunit